MSDEAKTETKVSWPEPLTATQSKDQIAARAEELKLYEGKIFAPNRGSAKPLKIVGYGGVRSHIETRDGKPTQIYSHTFVMENGWTPPATKFLSEWHEIAPKTESNQHPE
jgi:hypothetical protein